MAKTEKYTHLNKLSQYDKIIAFIDGCERKGATMPYISVNGNMFSFLDKDGDMGLRLAEKERVTFIDKHKTRLCESYGTVLKEYVLVPDKLFADAKKMKKYIEKSYAYAAGLKVKVYKMK